MSIMEKDMQKKILYCNGRKITDQVTISLFDKVVKLDASNGKIIDREFKPVKL